MTVFLSHNSKDKPTVRSVATQLQLMKINVWLDEWNLQPGDMLTMSISDALDNCDTILVFWSESAAQSNWVNAEINSAITQSITHGKKVIPIILDSTPLPALLSGIVYINGTNLNTLPMNCISAITGITKRSDQLMAMQDELANIGDLHYNPLIGNFFVCPNCGGNASDLHSSSALDEEHDRMYGIVKCSNCGYQEVSEI